MNNEIRKELIDYYKWIVNISIFVITVIVSLVSASDSLYFSSLLKFGLFLLGFAIILNWLLVKRLTILPILENMKPEDYKKIHLIFIKSLSLTNIYGLLQNLSFVFGVVLVFVTFLLKLNNT